MKLSLRRILSEAAHGYPETDHFKPERKIPPNLEAIHRGNMGKIGSYNVWTVNGTLVRDTVDIDFVAGGNPSRYSYVPLDEIWVERAQNNEDLAASIVHEFVECELMKKRREHYDRAHETASSIEIKLRHHFKDYAQQDENPLSVAKKFLKMQT